MVKVYEFFGGKKFLMALVAFATTCVMLWFGKVSESVYETVLIVTLGVYTAGNIANKYVRGNKSVDRGSTSDNK